MLRSSTGFDLTRLNDAQIETLAADLTGEERHVLLHHGTERAGCGVFLDNKRNGTYVCRLCGLPLFRSAAKFNSGTGWPSFSAPFDREHIEYLVDTSHGMRRTEIRCQRCAGHLGHVFEDGPPPAGERYCLNSAAMGFVEDGQPITPRGA